MSVNNTSFTIKNNLASSIRNYLKQQGKTNVTEKEMNTILQRMAQIDADRDSGKTQGGSIFSGGHKYLGGSGRDFVVKQGQQITLSQEEYNKVFEGFLDQMGTQKLQIPSKSPAQPTIQQPKFDEGKALQKLKQEMDKVEVEPLEIKETITSKDKTWNREVDGKKQMICERKENGKTVTYAVNQDGTLGEKLITKSTLGKNTYATQSQMNKDMRTMLGLGANDPMPTDIEGTYVEYRGEGFLAFKKDGKVMDNAQLREYAKKLHAQNPAQTTPTTENPKAEAPATGSSQTTSSSSAVKPAQTTTPTGGPSPAPSSVSTAKPVSTHAQIGSGEVPPQAMNLSPGSSISIQTSPGNYETWTKNQDNTLIRSHYGLDNNSGKTKILKDQYSADGKLISSEHFNELKGSNIKGLKTTKYYNNGKLTSRSSDFSNIKQADIKSAHTVDVTLLKIIQQGSHEFSSQIFKDNNGNVILTFKDGKCYDKNNKEVNHDKIGDILAKAFNKSNISKLEQIC